MSRDLPQWISPRTREQIVALRRIYDEGRLSHHAARNAIGLSDGQFRTLLKRLTGQTRWPVLISDEFLTIPVRSHDKRPTTHYAHRATVAAIPEAQLANRIERDQARLRAERDHWLAVEQEKYGLVRRHLSIDEMPL